MKFKCEFYRYQQDVLAVFQNELNKGDKKIHIVAPPGSGKTIMGLEMITRLGGNSIILVPNITLQYQWKDKLEKFFLENNENIENIVSLDKENIKKINILTYQSLTQTTRESDIFLNNIYDFWYKDFEIDFKNKEDFINYVNNLKEFDSEKYMTYLLKYKKKLKKDNQNTKDLISKDLINYFSKLKEYKVDCIILDEAHHLTNWWSKVIYFLWEFLSEKEGIFDNSYIIGLTATPPYDDIDFFELDDDYLGLLGEVDYYIPTPSVVKSGRLAPYIDLVYFVEPNDNLFELIKNNEDKLNNFLKENYNYISKILYSLIEKDFDKLIEKSYENLVSYLKFLKVFSQYDITEYYISEKINQPIYLDDIAKSVGRFLANYRLEGKIEKVDKLKRLFYDLGYIWRGNNFFKFRTPIENMLIYSKSKINGVKEILNVEYKNLGYKLKMAIITDFLEDKEDIITCKYIFNELSDFLYLNPILVSGQGIWMYNKNKEVIKLEKNILEITNMLENGETKLLIGTRGILGEGWDCPKLNTLIDLTGVVAFMSVNQVRGRPIRLDITTNNKLANIYDIVTVFDGYNKAVDFSRLKRKHEKTYGIDENGIVIKGIDHIIPNLKEKLLDYKNINVEMLERASKKQEYYNLWGILKEYNNKEIYGLNLSLSEDNFYLPFYNYGLFQTDGLLNLFKQKDLDKNFYYETIYKYLSFILKSIVNSMKKILFILEDFTYDLMLGKNGNYKLLSNYKDDLVIKKFMSEINSFFSTIIEQRYVLEIPFGLFKDNEVNLGFFKFGLPESISNNLENRKIFLSELSKLNIGITGKYLLSFNIFLNFKAYNLLLKFGNLFKSFSRKNYFNFIYLKGEGIDKKEYIGKKPFIYSQIEKIWL